jgi:predicted acyl esterase
MSEDTSRKLFRIDVTGDMTIEWDVPIEISDGVILRADVFRPTEPGFTGTGYTLLHFDAEITLCVSCPRKILSP